MASVLKSSLTHDVSGISNGLSATDTSVTTPLDDNLTHIKTGYVAAGPSVTHIGTLTDILTVTGTGLTKTLSNPSGNGTIDLNVDWDAPGAAIGSGTPVAGTFTTLVANTSLGVGTASPDGTMHILSGSAGAVSASPLADELTIEGSGNTGLNVLTPDANSTRVTFGAASDNDYSVLLGNYNAGSPFVTWTLGGTQILRWQSDGQMKVGTGTPSGQLHVYQTSATGAIPVLYLEQDDVSEEMIELNSTVGVGNAIEAVGAKSLTTTHFIKVTITGVGARYFPVGTIA